MTSENSCEVCGNTGFAEIKVAKHYTGDQPLHVCKVCGMVQVLDRRTSQEIYEDWIDQMPGDDVYLSADAAVAARHAFVMSFMGFDDHTIIDIGGGSGSFAHRVELETDSSVDSYDGMAEDIDGLTEYDVATILWTLENCGSANAVIEAAHRVTSDDGCIVVATGSRILVPFKKPLQFYLGKAPLDLHPWRFSANTLVALLMKHGYKVVETNRYIDSDYLVVVARKADMAGEISLSDNFTQVIDFFDRWHEESLHY
jgi:ubiquinone/menaquinone biosynthesis C-methylase UbiE